MRWFWKWLGWKHYAFGSNELWIKGYSLLRLIDEHPGLYHLLRNNTEVRNVSFRLCIRE